MHKVAILLTKVKKDISLLSNLVFAIQIPKNGRMHSGSTWTTEIVGLCAFDN